MKFKITVLLRPLKWPTWKTRCLVKSELENAHSTGSAEPIFKALALWADAIYKSKFPSVCPSVRVCVCSLFEVPLKRLFAPTSWSPMFKIFRDSESLRKSNVKKWSHFWTFLLKNGRKLSQLKKFFFFTFEVPFKRLFYPSRSWMSKIVGGKEMERRGLRCEHFCSKMV